MIAVLLHVHFADQLEYLLDKISNIHHDYHLYVNITDVPENKDTSGEIETRVDNMDNPPKALGIMYSINIGLDPFGTFRTLERVVKADQRYKYFVKLGTEDRLDQRLGLIEPILGDKEKVDKVYQMFEDNPKIGIIGGNAVVNDFHGADWDGAHKIGEEFVGPNNHWLSYFWEHYKIKPEARTMNFIAGTMFWIRADIWYHMIENFSIPWEAFDGWARRGDGNPEHALERNYGCLAMDLGYEVVSVV